MNEPAEERIDRMVEQIRSFAERVDDLENWMIRVPEDDFYAVKSRLDVDDTGLGTRYRGSALCYTNDHDEVWVGYSTPLSEFGLSESVQPGAAPVAEVDTHRLGQESSTVELYPGDEEEFRTSTVMFVVKALESNNET